MTQPGCQKSGSVIHLMTTRLPDWQDIHSNSIGILSKNGVSSMVQLIGDHLEQQILTGGNHFVYVVL